MSARLSGRWWRSGANGPSPQPRAPQPSLAALSQLGRRELLDAISAFLLDNDLAINPANLTLAWQAFGGASPSLYRRIAEKRREGEKITQAWLDEVTAAPPGEEHERETLRKALEDLHKSVTLFASSTTAARNATSAYGSALDRHLLELEEAEDNAGMVSRLATLAETIAERTRITEAELRTREQEAKALRRRLDKAKRDAEEDHLTGLPNRRAFEAEFERQYSEAEAAREPLSIAFCDIDHFKRINDVHGHDAGDRVLKLIAQLLAESSNDNCHVSRHGGEEFVLLFRGLTPSEAKVKLDAARESLAGRRLLNRETDEPFGQITFSAGVASVFAHENPRDALKAADEALYRAKEAGRNVVLLA